MGKIKFKRSQIFLAIQKAKKAALKNGHEICGLLVQKERFLDLVFLNNKIKRGGGFSFYVGEVRDIQKKVKKNGNEIIGTFHSHPSYIAKPSFSDIANTLDDSYMLIIDVMDEKIAIWHVKNLKAKKLKHALF